MAQLFVHEAMLNRMISFESALITALYEDNSIPKAVHDRTVDCLRSLKLDVDRLDAAGARDGVVVPELVRQVREALPTDCRRWFHCGATSQDLIDSALAIALRDFHVIVVARLRALDESIELLIHRSGNQPVTAHTRMQPAGPVRASDRLGSWKRSISEQIADADHWQDKVGHLQFAGPLGTRKSGSISDWDAVAARLAQLLGISDIGESWQTNRQGIALYASWLSVIAGTLGKIGQDFCLMAQCGEIRFFGGGGSSSIPGKRNPVQAEALVSLARFCALLVSGMHQSVVHEQERSGAAWTLEWMVLPQICIALGAALRTSNLLIASIVGFALPSPRPRDQSDTPNETVA